ncbi:MAG: sulfite exporter TauE/SafE family protein, partial [Chlorobiales bacterium]|nr:sulfite exporter TauE/SafE family protein [Chlorobiales bacterium]
TCAALVGSLVLALSTQWSSPNGGTEAFADKLRPHLWFSAGRIASYALAGGLLGLLGGSVRFSSGFTSITVVAISLLMLVLAMQMLGFSPLNALRIALPKRVIDRVGSGVTREGLLRPFPTGFMTILLPCGFTMAAEGAAILSGTPWKGIGIMTAFVFGTMPPLLAIGLSGAELSGRPATSRIFMKTAGLLVIFFTLFNLNTQFGIAGRIASRNTPPTVQASAPATVNTRIVRTVASNGSLANAQFELRAGEQVRFIVDPKDNGSGCMNAIMIPGLWNQPQYLSKGKPIVMQFTPLKRGTYQITCAMGMPWGVITVK